MLNRLISETADVERQSQENDEHLSTVTDHVQFKLVAWTHEDKT